MFNDYNGDLRLCSRSERSNSVNIRGLFRAVGMLNVFIFGHGCCFGIRRFQNSLGSRRPALKSR